MIQRLVTCIVVSALIQTGCTHVERRFDHDLSETRCEDALQNLPEHNISSRILDGAQTVAGSALSYTATGAAYVADTVVTVVGGVVIFAALCGPFILLASSGSDNGSNQHLICIPADLSGLRRPRWGEETYESTRHLRCRDLTGASQSVRKVAACFADRADTKSLEAARQALETLTDSSDFRECVSSEERLAVQAQLEQINSRK